MNRGNAVVLLVAVAGTTGCWTSDQLPDPLSKSEAALVARTRLDLAVGLARPENPDGWDARIPLDALRGTHLFKTVDYLDQLRVPPDLIVQGETYVDGSAVIPLPTFVTLGLVPTVTKEGWGYSYAFSSPKTPSEKIEIQVRYRGEAAIGGLAYVGKRPEGWTNVHPIEHQRMYDRLALELALNSAVLERLAQKRAPARGAPGSGASAAGIRWVALPGGSFLMGSDEWLYWKPHRVTLKPFELAKTLVTNKQYRACVEAGACTAAHASDGTCLFRSEDERWVDGRLPESFRGDDQPVVCVDWGQAKAFSEWVGGSLPSEAQWEYAARSAGKRQAYPWGDAPATCERAVIDDGGPGCARRATWPVCSKAKGDTAQGLCDMAGNAAQWLQDWYQESYAGAPADGSARESPAGPNRALRGGSWRSDALNAQSTLRSGASPGFASADNSFRPARPAQPPRALVR